MEMKTANGNQLVGFDIHSGTINEKGFFLFMFVCVCWVSRDFDETSIFISLLQKYNHHRRIITWNAKTLKWL